MSQVRINDIDVTVNDSRSYSRNLGYVFLKRIIDVFGALFGLIILSPILIAIGISIMLDSKGPIFYSQVRVGKDGVCFKMYKFRSMVTNAEELLEKIRDKNEMDGPMFKIKKDPRVTNIGKFIRRTSIDELPQLMNVLIGDMSLVGPRPSLPNEVAKFEPWMMERLTVKPGLTCFWQVSGRNNIGFKEWMKMDVKYIRERNTLTDIKLILKTAMLVLGDNNAH